MSKTQEIYEAGNAELKAALESRSVDGSNNHAIIACAYYLRAITEMIGVKFKEHKDE